jgi:hypothetical protein
MAKKVNQGPADAAREIPSPSSLPSPPKRSHSNTIPDPVCYSICFCPGWIQEDVTAALLH